MNKRLVLIAITFTTLISILIALVFFSGLTVQSQSPVPTSTDSFGPVVGGPTSAPNQPASPTIQSTAATPISSATSTPTTATIAATAIATSNSGPALPTLQKSMMGIQSDAYFEQSRWSTMVDRADNMGFGWLKIQLSWKALETSKGTYSAAFSAIETNAVYAARRHYKIMLSIDAAPDWARPVEARGQLDGPPANPQDFADFIGAVLDQFPLEYVNAIELWNEPNLQREWNGVPLDPKTYLTYFNAGYKAIRSRSAQIVVISAGPAPTGGSTTPNKQAVDDRTWISGLYAAGLPTSDPYFALGAHPYGWANPPAAHCCASPSNGWDDRPTFFFLDTLNDYRQIMLKNNHQSGKIWATEFGWATFQGLRVQSQNPATAALLPADKDLTWMNTLTEAQQAQDVVDAFALAQSGDLASYMGPMMLWNLNFSVLVGYVNSDKPSLPEAGFSVLNADTFPRPVYYLLQSSPKK